jgi:transposase InsO family protein
LDYITRGLDNVYVYIDDLIICHNDHESHLRGLASVFDRLRKYNLKCSPGKLQIACQSINYLGFNLSKEHGIRAGAAKTEAVRKWSPPTNVREVKQFLGLCSFFRRTIANFASIASPLTRLTRKDSGWVTGLLPEEALRAFLQLRKLLCERPCLTPVNFDREFIVTVDTSSSHGMGAILSQVGEDGVEHPCAYASRVMTAREKGDSAFVAEHKGCLWACRTFRPYLSGKHFILRSDHRPLVALNNTQKQVMSRVYAEMEEFLPYTIQYLPGKIMPADGLSRYSQVCSISMTPEQVFHLQKQDKQSKALFCYHAYGKKPGEAELRRLVEHLGDRVSTPEGLVRILDKQGRWRAFAPLNLRLTLVQLCHDSAFAGHFNAQKTYDRLAQDWYWPECRKEVFDYCRRCHACATVNAPAHRRPVPLRPLAFPGRFNERLSVDLMGPWPTCKRTGNKYLLVINEAYSKLVQLCPIPDKTADTVVSAILDNWISQHGCCETLLSDKGKEFANSLMQKLCDKLQIQHVTSSTAHPRSNGLAENHNRTILAYLRKYLEGSNDWVSQLPALQLAYNSAPHSTTGYTPFFLAYNRHPVMPYSLVEPLARPDYSPDDLSQKLQCLQSTQVRVRHLLEEAFHSQKAQFDKRARARTFRPGDRVYVDRAHTGHQFQKFQALYKGPYILVAPRENDNYVIMDEASGKKITLHAEHLKHIPFLRQFTRDPASDLAAAAAAHQLRRQQPADLGDHFPPPPAAAIRAAATRRRRLRQPLIPPPLRVLDADEPLPAVVPNAALLPLPVHPDPTPPDSPPPQMEGLPPEDPLDAAPFHGWPSDVEEDSDTLHSASSGDTEFESPDSDPGAPPAPPQPGPSTRSTSSRGTPRQPSVTPGRGAPPSSSRHPSATARRGATSSEPGPVSLPGTLTRLKAKLTGVLPSDAPLLDRRPRSDRGRGRGGRGGPAAGSSGTSR